jgi:hypothetical protein
LAIAVLRAVLILSTSSYTPYLRTDRSVVWRFIIMVFGAWRMKLMGGDSNGVATIL